MQFLPNAYQIATGSDDNTVKIWDLRRKGCIKTVLAHTKLISDIKFEQEFEGRIMVTSSYDYTAKIWATGDWIPIRTLSGHENKVTSANVTKDLKYVLTTSFDRTFKLWHIKNNN